MSDSGVSGLVLAAGMGQRVGMAKLRLTVRDETYLHRCVGTLRAAGTSDVVCVVSPDEAGWAATEVPGAHIVVNPTGSAAMISSVRVGIAALHWRDGVVIMPVDHPDVRSATIHHLLEAAGRNPGSLIKPVCDGNAGHPILVPHAMFAAILASGEHETLREMVAASGINIIRIEVNDRGVLRNVNTTGDLESGQSTEE
jgi:molybdenum cofactor cytidylyltransferase